MVRPRGSARPGDGGGHERRVYVPLQNAAFALLEMHSRFDARLGPDHPLSQGFGKLRDDAWQQLAQTPGGVATAWNQFGGDQREAVRSQSQAELSAFVARRRAWIVESLPLAGLKLPRLEPRPVTAVEIPLERGADGASASQRRGRSRRGQCDGVA